MTKQELFEIEQEKLLKAKEGLDDESHEEQKRKEFVALFRPPTKAEREAQEELERLEREEFVRLLKEDIKKKD